MTAGIGLLRQRVALARGQRPLGVQGLGRRLHAGSAGAPAWAHSQRRIDPYPSFSNEGTTQPKVDVRVDYDFEDGRRLVFQGGVAGTDGILHSGIGPFDIDSGTVLGYGKVNYSKGAMKLNFFTNILNGDATNLLAVGLDGQPLNFIFKSNTYDVEFGDVRTFQQRHVLSYGGNFRYSNFDLSIAPAGRLAQGRRRLRPGRDLPGQVRAAAARRARSTSSTSSRTCSSRRGRR